MPPIRPLPPSPITPLSHELFRRGDPITSRLHAQAACAKRHRRLAMIAVRSLKRILESPGLTQNEYENKYPCILENGGQIGRGEVKYFNQLMRRGLVRSDIKRRCRIGGGTAQTWFVTPEGVEWLLKNRQINQQQADGALYLVKLVEGYLYPPYGGLPDG